MVQPAPHEETSWLDQELPRWVHAGIISAEQAGAIARFEASGPSGVSETARPGPGRVVEVLEAERPPPPGRPLGLVGEALAYLGIVLVAVSGTFVVVRFWDDLHVGGRLGVGLLVALVGLTSGSVARRGADPGARRLGSFLALCGTGGVALVAGVAAVALGGGRGATALAAGAAALAVSLVLWQNRDEPLSFLSALGGAVSALVGLQDLVHLNPTPTETAGAVWVVALALAALGLRGIVHPAPAAMVVGTVGALGGALAIADRHQGAGLALGLLTAGGAVLAGVVGRHNELTGTGVVGFLVFLARTLGVYIQGTASALAVLFLGVVLVALALRHRHHRGGTGPSSGRGASPLET